MGVALVWNFPEIMKSYSEWRKAIADEIRAMEQTTAVWNVNGHVIIDCNGHALNHCGYELIERALHHACFDQLGVTEQTVIFSQPVGYCECVHTTPNDSIIYVQREGRKGVTRFILDKDPAPCNSVFLVLKKKPNNKVFLITAYVGVKSEVEPWDKKATAASIEFWKHHALVATRDMSLSDDRGDKYYWNKQINK